MIVSYADRPLSSLPILEEHFLERISALEYAMGRLDERLNEVHDLVQQLAAESLNDHTMIESIADALKRVQALGKRDLDRDWRRPERRGLQKSTQQERLERSKKVFLRAFRGKDRNRFTRLIEESNQLFARKNFRRGLEILEKAFNADPENLEVGISLGKIYYEFEKFASAGKCLRRVLKSDPRHFEANLLTGLLAKRKGDLSKAREFLSNATDLCDTSLAAHVSLGSVFAALGEDSKALNHYSRALSLKASPQLCLLVAWIYFRQGRMRDAIKHMKKAIQMDPSCHEAFFRLGLAFLEQNWKRKARECFQTALHLNPKDSRYQDALELLFSNDSNFDLKMDLPPPPAINDESVDALVQDELHLNFRRTELKVRSKGEGLERK